MKKKKSDLRTLYFTDWEYSDEQVKKEMRDINRSLNKNGVTDCNVTESTQIPPFVGHSEEKYYDVMFFDFGGVNQLLIKI